MKQLKTFEHPMFGELSVIIIDGKEHFGATDIANQLGYADPHKAIKQHTKEKGWVNHLVLTSGGKQQKKFINEGNLYRLITRSELPDAENFESWVFDEVLPSIRKRGAYMTPRTIDNMIDNPDFGIQLLTKLKEEREEKEALQIETVEKDKLIGELKPKVAYTDIILKKKAWSLSLKLRKIME